MTYTYAFIFSTMLFLTCNIHSMDKSHQKQKEGVEIGIREAYLELQEVLKSYTDLQRIEYFTWLQANQPEEYNQIQFILSAGKLLEDVKSAATQKNS